MQECKTSRCCGWKTFLCGAVIILVFAGLYLGAKNFANLRQGIAVKGFAEEKIVSDLGVWRARVEVSNKEMVTAYQSLSSQKQQVVDFLKELGVVESQINFEPVFTSVQYKYQDQMPTNEVENYTLDQEFTVTSENIELIQKLALESTRLIQKDIRFSSYKPQYFYTKLDTLKINMLRAAAEDARMRAEAIAQSNGCQLRSLKSGSQGVFQITPEYSNEISSYGYSDDSSIKKSIRAVVNMTYRFKCR